MTLEMKVQMAQEYIQSIKKEKRLYKIALENSNNQLVDNSYIKQVKK